MSSLQSRHIDHVVSVATGPGGAPGLMARSWSRCVREHGLDPARPSAARILPAHEVRAHRQSMAQFLRVARAGMEDLYRRVADLGYMVLLTDAQGITVDHIGHPSFDDQLRRAGLYLGADWNEARAGTCGVGTCLVEQVPLTCHQTDHFDATHIALTCTTAPLFDHAGRLVAVLDVSALRSPEDRASQHLVRELVTIQAERIESADFLRHFDTRWVLRLGNAWGLAEVAGEVMLAFDEDGRVAGANSGGRRLFADAGRWSSGDLAGRSLPELLEAPMASVWRLAGGAGQVVCRGRPLHAALRAPRPKATAVPTPRREAPAPSPLDRLAGDDGPMQALLDRARRIVGRGIPVLVQGETGSGKEVLARALHAGGPRAAAPFVAVNCAALPESLIESELFGYLPGAFTGGRAKGAKGLIAQADGGTLFLDEIGDMPLVLQTRLLRVLAEGEVMPLGGDTPVRVDLAVIAASHRPLTALVARGDFREDLYYRLCGATLELPPLRERADLGHVIDTVFHEEAAAQQLRAALSPEARARLLSHDWPGNARELRNVLRLALALCDGGVVRGEDVSLPARPGVPAARVDDTADAARLVDVLRRHRWRVKAAADELGICRATLYRQMKSFDIVAPERG